jgi:hypothetical protein
MAWKEATETKLEDIIECVALVLITVGVVATAFYVQKIHELLKRGK